MADFQTLIPTWIGIGLCKALLATTRKWRNKEETADARETTAAAPELAEPTGGLRAETTGPGATVAGIRPSATPGPAAAGPGPAETPGAAAAGPRPAEARRPAATPELPEAHQQTAAGQEAERPGTWSRSRKSVATAAEREA
ncbi:hypothetical protein NDU88_008485 [Pleurodeles waltl]|uniref:Uncharacterized protein n=1 Tax=Pleurodeles waltl TaxID=8319 RepID=A0AAV7QUN9_PLEWA|nr:hypothetical protein NDU88_008485 [Pleurodeles waltl]